tara:strand:+ start:544 stop:1350 length:807 start_codon:yes stop_codon:yes gene_type:complete
MQFSIITSSLLHVGFIIFTILGLPIFNNPNVDIPPIIQVEILEITEQTNVPEISKREVEEKKIGEKKKDNVKINQPIMKPKIEKSDEKVKDPAPEEEIIKPETIAEKNIVNMPIRKPVLKKKDNFDELKIAELIDMAQDTKPIEDAKDEEYESLDSTETLSDKLTLSEEDAIRSQFLRCWSVPLGIKYDDSMVVKVKITLKQDGSLMKPPEVTDHQRMNKPSEKYFKVLAESALRAVRRCDPIKAPAADRYDKWKDMQLSFDPRELLR